jgi:hypothetical protein
MGIFVLLAAAGLIWAWATGRLKKVTHEDVVAALLFLLGFEMLTKGVLLPGAGLMAVSLFWAAWRRKPRAPATPPMPTDEARRLLGVRTDASLAEIRDAHRRLRQRRARCPRRRNEPHHASRVLIPSPQWRSR